MRLLVLVDLYTLEIIVRVCAEGRREFAKGVNWFVKVLAMPVSCHERASSIINAVGVPYQVDNT